MVSTHLIIFGFLAISALVIFAAVTALGEFIGDKTNVSIGVLGMLLTAFLVIVAFIDNF